MKLVFFSSDAPEVEMVRRAFSEAGIECEIRQGPDCSDGISENNAFWEVWIQDAQESHRASMVCAHLGVGFSKRAPRKPFLDPDWYI